MSIRQVILAIVLAMSTALVMAENKRVVFIPKGNTHVFWKEMARGAGDFARQNGVTLVWRGPVLEDDTEAQASLIRLYAEKQFDGLILAPNSPLRLNGALLLAQTKGLKVLTVDSALQGRPDIPLVETDNRQAGRMAAEQAVRDRPGMHKVLLLRYSSEHLSTQEREEGFRERLQQLLPTVQIIDQYQIGITVLDSRNKTLPLLQQYPDVDVVFTSNESSTEGVIQALQEAGLSGKIAHYGFDFSLRIHNALRDGYLRASMMQDPYRMGVEAMKAVLQMMQGQAVAGIRYTPAILLTDTALQDPQIRRKTAPYLELSRR